MRNISLCGDDWSLYYIKNEELALINIFPKTRTDLISANLPCVPATVPGNLETDLYAAGKIEDPFFGNNHLNRENEYLHMFYVHDFDYNGSLCEPELYFEGLDTIAEIYVNGVLAGKSDNMLIPHAFPVDGLIKKGKNEIVVHILPVVIAARDFEITPNDSAFRYNFASLHIRKAPHMFAWDITPRMISGGIWRPLCLRENPKDRIIEDGLFLCPTVTDSETKTAALRVTFNVHVASDDIFRYRLRIHGVCGDSEFSYDSKLFHTGGSFEILINNAKLWWPRNYGKPNLYDVTVELVKDGSVVDTVKKSIGLRTVKLVRTSVTNENGDGDFRFIVNGKSIFAMGTNWVPVDALHSRDHERLPKILPLLSDLGCNIIRIWGGSVYEDDMLYDYCDRDGIMVWQDFMMGCAIYPQDESFIQKIREELTAAVKRLRNHPCIILWAGNNENDYSYGWDNLHRNPNTSDLISRKIIPRILDEQDFSRPYLPSSPYIDDEAFEKGEEFASEFHLWGPRDYFKGDFYRNSICHFVSETGYHGCPSPVSLKKFISPEKLWTATDNEHWTGIENDEWISHSSAQETGKDDPFVYRTRLMADQVTTLFGNCVPCTLDDFARASQISQAEAKKYFIERFRLSKWRRTGIIWWNLIDCWPQISDAIMDYYFTKKLAYEYVKRSQTPLCLMFDEPENGFIALYAANDGEEKAVRYTVKELSSGKTVCSGKAVVPADSSVKINSVPVTPEEKKFYLIEWECDGKHYSNHYMTNIIDIDYKQYLNYIKTCGYDSFEGFED